MDRICVGAVRVGDIIIYRNDLVSSNLKEFITLIEKDKNFYFDYLRRRNKIIKLREQSLLDELSQL